MTAAAAILGAQGLASASQFALNEANIRNQRATNETSIALANTQHQREVADLLLAGLNPILSAQGAGASVPTLGTPDLKNVAEGLPSTAKELGRYVSDQYREGVLGQTLKNDFQQIVNSAAESERASSAIRADNDRLLAEAEQDAIREELGQRVDLMPDGRTEVVYDPSQYERAKSLIREGVRSDLKNRANSNWRNNLRSFIPFINSAKGFLGF